MRIMFLICLLFTITLSKPTEYLCSVCKNFDTKTVISDNDTCDKCDKQNNFQIFKKHTPKIKVKFDYINADEDSLITVQNMEIKVVTINKISGDSVEIYIGDNVLGVGTLYVESDDQMRRVGAYYTDYKLYTYVNICIFVIIILLFVSFNLLDFKKRHKNLYK